MIRLSIPLRQALARLSLPVLIAAAFGTMLLGKADALLVERARMVLADMLSPIWAAVQQPVQATRDAVAELGLKPGVSATAFVVEKGYCAKAPAG